MSSRILMTALALLIPGVLSCAQKQLGPDHLMVGPGIFDVDQDHPRFMAQVEYRWQVRHHLRPLLAFFLTTDRSFFICTGLGYDIFFGRRVVLTPTFAPGIYAHCDGKKLGFPLNFRSAIELAYVFDNQGRFGAQYGHISNAGMFRRNPGVDSLVFYYAIPFPNEVKKKS